MSLTKVPSSMTSFEGTTFNGEVRSYDSADQGNFVGGASGTANRIQIRGASHPSTPNVITMDTNGSERMRIDSSGNLGIGVTPSAWYSSTKVLQVGIGSMYSTTTTQNTFFSSNEYLDSSANPKYIISDYATRYQQYSGQHRWFTAPSGTAGNAITFTEQMRLNSSGNLLVGTATPSAKLMVVADIGNVIAGRGTNPNFDSVVGFFGADRNTTNGSYTFIDCYCYGTSTYRFRVLDSGNCQNVNNSYGALSDQKLKENIVDASPKLDDLCKVKVRNYNLIGDELKQIGVIAQELEEIFPGMVDETPDYEEVTTTDEDGNEKTERVATGTTTKSVKYSVFVPMLVKAIQELTQRIEALEAG